MTTLHNHELPMPSLTVRDIPDKLLRRLRANAEANRRSLNAEVIISLERAAGLVARDPAALLALADAVRARATAAGARPLTPERLERARRRGRP